MAVPPCRGLKRRLEELVADNDEALAALEEASEAARILPWTGWSKGWRSRLGRQKRFS